MIKETIHYLEKKDVMVYLRALELFKRNRHYMNELVDEDELPRLRKLQFKFEKVLEKLNELYPKLVKKNNQEGIESIRTLITINTQFVNILKKNFTVTDYRANDLYDETISAIKHFNTYV